MLRRRRRWELGDIFTVPCGEVRGLAQYETRGTHWRTRGDWLRVLAMSFEAVPDDPVALFDGKAGWLEHGFVRNWTDFGDIEFLMPGPAPARSGDVACKSPPAFLEDGVVTNPWIVFDGSDEYWYDSLPERFDDLPLMGLADGRSLCPRLREGWTPRDALTKFGRSCALDDDTWEFLATSNNLVVEGSRGSRVARPKP